MSRENVEVVRGTFDAFQARDLDAFLSYMDPEVEYRSLVLEVEGVYCGHEGIRSWWESVLAVFPDWSPKIEDARDLGDRVLVRVRAEGRGDRQWDRRGAPHLAGGRGSQWASEVVGFLPH